MFFSIPGGAGFLPSTLVIPKPTCTAPGPTILAQKMMGIGKSWRYLKVIIYIKFAGENHLHSDAPGRKVGPTAKLTRTATSSTVTGFLKRTRVAHPFGELNRGGGGDSFATPGKLGKTPGKLPWMP